MSTALPPTEIPVNGESVPIGVSSGQPYTAYEVYNASSFTILVTNWAGSSFYLSPGQDKILPFSADLGSATVQGMNNTTPGVLYLTGYTRAENPPSTGTAGSIISIANGTVTISGTPTVDANVTNATIPVSGSLDANITNSSIPVTGNLSAYITNASVPVTGTVSINTSGGSVPVYATGTVAVSSITNTVSVAPVGTVNVQGVSGGTAIGIAGTVTVDSGTVNIGNTPSVVVTNASLAVTGSVDANITNSSVAITGLVDVGTVDNITAGSLEIINNSATVIPSGSEENYSMTMTTPNTSYTAAPAVSSRTFFMIQNPSTETLSFGFGSTGNIFTLEPSQGYEEIVGTNPLITLAITVQGTIANQPVSIVTWE